MLRWAAENLLDLPCAQIGEHYGRYRSHQPEAERAMARSLDRSGQLSPVVVCQREGRYELIDGFKRLGAARGLAPMHHLSARVLKADDRAAKAAIYGLNRPGGRTRELEEAWIVQALVRDDGLSQVEVAELLVVTRVGSAGDWHCSSVWGPSRRTNCAWDCSPPLPRGSGCGCRKATRANFSKSSGAKRCRARN